MNIVDLTNQNFSQNRSAIRKEIITIFLEEKPGKGKSEKISKYRYVTKILPDGREIYLNRPANFNNGFDFTLNVSHTNFNQHIKDKRASTRPTHGNIYDDLVEKRVEDTILYDELWNQIELIYSCKLPTNDKLNFKSGHSTELILECLKWLFIEQDVTYWNYSGRAMLYESIRSI